MSKEKEMKQHLQQYDKDTLIELYLQKDFDTKQQLAEKDKEIAQKNEYIEKLQRRYTQKSEMIDTLRFKFEGERIRVKNIKKKICGLLDQIEKGEKDE